MRMRTRGKGTKSLPRNRHRKDRKTRRHPRRRTTLLAKTRLMIRAQTRRKLLRTLTRTLQPQPPQRT